MFTVRSRRSQTLARGRRADPRPWGGRRPPAFVPLATRGGGQALEPRDVEALGYEMVLGNTFHLFLGPGHELVRRAGRAESSRRAGSGRSSPIRAASRCSRPGMGVGRRDQGPRGAGGGGGRGRARSRTARSCRSRRRASASAPMSTGRSGSSAPRHRWRSRPRSGSDIALVFDECTPFHVSRDYTARSMERTHR